MPTSYCAQKITNISNFLVANGVSHVGILAIGQKPGPFKDLMGRLLVGRGDCAVIRAIGQKESGKGVKRRLLLAHERRAEQNRRIEHGRIRLDQTVRQVAALGEPDKNLLTVCKRRGVQQRGHRFADRRAFPLPFLHAAAVRIPVIAAHVRPWIGGAE